MQLKIRMLLLCATATLLSSCIKSGEDNYCALARPIYTQCADALTDETARQIFDHDSVGGDKCGWTRHASFCSDGKVHIAETGK